MTVTYFRSLVGCAVCALFLFEAVTVNGMDRQAIALLKPL
jgi:hypothetical protein